MERIASNIAGNIARCGCPLVPFGSINTISKYCHASAIWKNEIEVLFLQYCLQYFSTLEYGMDLKLGSYFQVNFRNTHPLVRT